MKELGPLAKSDEDILLGMTLPMQAKDFLILREKGDLCTHNLIELADMGWE